MFWGRRAPRIITLECPVEGCPFTCNSSNLMNGHMDCKHPELVKKAVK